jgi:UDP-glucose 4-epimerase
VFSANGLNMLIARISNPYGPGQDYAKGVGLVDAGLKRALSRQTVDWEPGSRLQSYLRCVQDAVCLDWIQREENTFNVSSGSGSPNEKNTNKQV